RETGVNVKLTITDNGFMLTIPKHYDLDWINLFKQLNSSNIEEYVKRVLKKTEMFRRRFRHCATRSFMILRKYRDRERSLHKLQINADMLLNVIENLQDFPVLKETYREILEDHMHIDAAKEVLDNIHRNVIEVKLFGPTRIPSPFAHNIVVHGYSDVVLMEDMKKMLKLLHEQVIEYLKKKGLIIEETTLSFSQN
ncbi:MAG: ATP-dependent helicase, partial [Desulfurococcaceae archaeon]